MKSITIGKWIPALAIAIASLPLAGIAAAQSTEQAATSSSRELAPPTHAVEIAVAAGYAQGFGKVASGAPSLTDVGNAGGALELGVGYRLLPELALGIYGSGAMFGRGDSVDSSANLYAATAGVQADWHFVPAAYAFDPWVSLGTGWRGYWIHADQGDISRQGLELAKLRVGVDYRIASSVAVSPVLGADLSMFLSESAPGSGGFKSISSPNVNTFVFGGVQGRFDIGGAAAGARLAAR
jgi:hypothetical protein